MRTAMQDKENLGRRKLRSLASAPRKLRVIAIASGKGGVGKTSLAVNLAVLAAREGRRVLLIDGDLGVGSAELLLGIRPRHHIGELINGSLELDEVLSDGPGGIKFLAGGAGEPGLGSLGTGEQLRLIGSLEDLGDQFDLVLVDSGSGLTDTMLFFAGSAEEVVLVVSPEPTSLAASCAALKLLAARAVTRFQIVVNPADDEQTAREVFEKMARATESPERPELRYLGRVPYDQNLRRAVAWQRPLVELFPHTQASNALRELERALVSNPSPLWPGGGLKFLSQRLLRDSLT